jgi:hypothetical protein
MKNRIHEQKGAVVPFLALALPVLIAGLGFGIDTGAMYEMNRRMQTATDAAALAAAQEIRTSNFWGYEAAAVHDAAENGFGNDAETDIEVSRPPSSGPRVGDNRFVEVRISRPAPTYFMAAFVDEPETLTSRAVAGVSPADSCIYVLNPTDANSFDAGGSSTVNLAECGLWVNSDSSSGAVATGSSNVQAASISVVGDYDGDGFAQEPYTGAIAQDDPFADFELPDYPGCDSNKSLKIQTEVTLDPGIYCGGIVLNANADVTLNPGTYVLKGGGMTAHGGAKIQGDEVTFVNTAAPGKPYGPIWFNGGSHADLSAPESGLFKGILFFQDPEIESNKTNIFSGSSSMQLSGVLYFPTTEVKFSGTFSATPLDLMLIADKVEFDGNASFAKLADDFVPTALTFARLVE